MADGVSRGIQQVERAVTEIVERWKLADSDLVRSVECDLAEIATSGGRLADRGYYFKTMVSSGGRRRRLLLVVAFAKRGRGISRIPWKHGILEARSYYQVRCGWEGGGISNVIPVPVTMGEVNSRTSNIIFWRTILAYLQMTASTLPVETPSSSRMSATFFVTSMS